MKRSFFFALPLVCLFTLALSLFWMIAPATLAPRAPRNGANGSNYFWIYDEGGLVAVAQLQDGTPIAPATYTDIFVNLLPEQKALQLKQGVALQSKESVALFLGQLRP